MPIVHDGEVVGAIGVSGASSADEDQELARDRRRARSHGSRERRTAATARLLPAATPSDSKFETGGLLLDDGPYKIDAGRRDAPGEVEYHERVVDVMHVVEGSATVVTGGEMRRRARGRRPASCALAPSRAARRTSSARATSSRSRAACRTSSLEVSDPFLYFVVKVEA